MCSTELVQENTSLSCVSYRQGYGVSLPLKAHINNDDVIMA